MKHIILTLIMSFFMVHIFPQAERNDIEFIYKAKELSNLGNYEEAIDLIIKNKDKFNIENPSDKLIYNILLGVNYYLSEEYIKAIEHLSYVVPLLESDISNIVAKKDINVLQLYYFLGKSYFITKQEGYNETLHRLKYLLELSLMKNTSLYEETVELINSIEYVDISQSIINNILKSNHNEAINQIKYIILNREDINNIEKALWLKKLGDQYYYIGNIDYAESCYLNSIELINDENHEQYRQILSTLSMIYSTIYNAEKALRFGIKAKYLYEKNRDFGYNYIICLSHCSIAYSYLGNRLVAKFFIDTAISKFKKLKTNSYDENILFNQSDWEKNTVDYPISSLLTNAAEIYSKLGLYEEAIQKAKEAILICENQGLKNLQIYNNLGCIYLFNNNYKEAEKYFYKAYNEENIIQNKFVFGYNLILTQYFNNNKRLLKLTSDVLDVFMSNIKYNFTFLSSNERQSYIRYIYEFIPFANYILYKTGKEKYNDKIYENIISTKNLLLRSSNNIRNAIKASRDSINLLRYDSLCDYKRNIIKEHSTESLEKLQSGIDLLEKKILRNIYYNNIDIKYKDIIKELNKDEVAIEFCNIPYIEQNDTTFFEAEPQYCAIILKNKYNKPHIIPLIKKSKLINIDKGLYYKNDSIYSLIWKPLEKELKGVKNIYFSPAGELNNIAIEYVMDSEGVRMNEMYNMYRLSTTRDLVEKTERKPVTKAVLYGGLNYYADINDITEINKKYLMANNVYRSGERNTSLLRDNFSYLPGTSMEIKAISDEISKYENINTTRFTGLSGTENSFISLSNSNIDILHLATHGFFYSEDEANEKKSMLAKYFNPNQSSEDKALIRSGLIFSGANIAIKGDSIPEQMEDGILTALEISNMNFHNLDLVVLSACDTGRGEYNSEGVFGLQRGFKLAGAKSILMSLWKVDDMATNMFMTEFYKNYLSGKSKILSLKKAQEFVRSHQEFSDPKYWAGFILLDGLN